MTISIRSRIRNALVGLALLLCVGFSGIIFMIAFVIEDRMFVNQLKVQQRDLIEHLQRGNDLKSWRASLPGIQILNDIDELDTSLTHGQFEIITTEIGVHEYYNTESAGFVSHVEHPINHRSLFLQYDVSDLLVVRGSKNSILILLGVLSLLITGVAVLISRRLATVTLTPVQLLTDTLDAGQGVSVINDLVSKFSTDEVGVLAKELAKSIERAHDSAQREFEFNQGVSHELRSPLQVAKSAVELLELRHRQNKSKILRDGREMEGQAQPEIPRLKRAIQQMEQVTEAFLWLASDKSTAGVTSSAKDIKSLCESAWPSVDIRFDSEPCSGQAYSIPVSPLIVIIRSLINNAVEHGDKSPVRVSCLENRINVSNGYTSIGSTSTGFGLGESIASRLCRSFNCKLLISNNKTEMVYCASILLSSESSSG